MRINESDFGGRPTVFHTELSVSLMYCISGPHTEVEHIHHLGWVLVQQIMSDPTCVKHTFMESLVHEMSMISSSDLFHLRENRGITATVVSH